MKATNNPNLAPPRSSEKAITLALTLAQAEEAIHAFSENQVDAIVDQEGRTHLLRPAQEHLRQQAQHLLNLLDSIGDGITVLNQGGMIVSQNLAATRMLGYGSGELIGQSFFDFVKAEELSGFYAAFFKVIENFLADEVVEFQLLDSSGLYRRIEATVSKLRDPTEMGVVLNCRDVSVLRPAHAESMRREKELADSLVDRDRFLAVLSHELRVPLSPIRFALDDLRNEELSPSVQSNLEMIRRNLDVHQHLLDDLIDFTALGQSKVRLRLEAIDAHETVRNVLETCRNAVTAARVEVRLDLQAADRLVLADSVRLQQVLWNLVKNAVIFSPPGSYITITTANQTNSWLTIEITDHGTGIDPKLLPFVFDSFRQGDLTSAPCHDGLGLGLFIAKEMAEAQGGTLTAFSEGRGKGAMFRFTLPTTPPTRVIAPQTPNL